MHAVYVQPSSIIVQYFTVLYIERKRLLCRCVACFQISFIYLGTVVTKLYDTGCSWCGSWMVWMLIIHALYMCAKSNVCMLHTLWRISGRLIQRLSYMHFTCSVILSSRIAHFMSALLMWIENWIIILDHMLTWNSQEAWQICRVTLVRHMFQHQV